MRRLGRKLVPMTFVVILFFFGFLPEAVGQDVGVGWIVSPPDTIPCGTWVPVSAVVCNFGNSQQTFAVQATIDSSGGNVYTNSTLVNSLAPHECTIASFPDWPVPSPDGINSNVTIYTTLISDTNSSNDTQNKNVYAQCPTGIEEDIGNEKLKMKNFQFFQAQPNPFTHSTVIRYSFLMPSHITLQIINIAGQLVKTIVDERKEPGIYSIQWDGKDSMNREVKSGVYFYRLQIRDFTSTKKLVVVR